MIDQPWIKPLDAVLEAVKVRPETGLEGAEVAARLRQFGPNRLREFHAASAWRILAEQFKSLIILLLGAAAALSYGFGDLLEGSAILVVICINAAIGFGTELKAVRSMEALRRMGTVQTRVRRGGRVTEVPADALVPGDIVVVEGGDVVTADIRLTAASRLEADESALTGESLPVAKQTAPVDAETPLAERTNMLYKGTAVTRGAGEGVVVATGMATELGGISALVAEARDDRTPLQKRLDQLGHKLIWVTLGITAVIGAMGLLRGRELFITLEMSIALAVAAIPEGLPIVATIALARGMRRMARRNALLNRLSSVETLGATTLICTDKTGTLTENRMSVSRLVVDDGEIRVDRAHGFTLDDRPIEPADRPTVQAALRAALLCNNAAYEASSDHLEPLGVGDPMEVALLRAGALAGVDRNTLLETLPEVREEAFDSESQMMATFHQGRDGFLVAVKGAPEAILQASARVLTGSGEIPLDVEGRLAWTAQIEALAGRGLRVLALAEKHEEGVDASPYRGLTLIGLVGLIDPPRPDVREALDRTRAAGIRVVMVTGDQPLTARNIAREVGLADEETAPVIHGKVLKDSERLPESARLELARAAIFARVTPKQKLDLVALYQAAGEVVAMTGDGVNDAPALKKADIGIAMGLRGTQVAREAADMVLKDDAFASIVEAIGQGRVIFDNIRKFVVYLLSCNVSEIACVGLASVAGAPLPMLPLQILFLNLVTDVFPALALGVGAGSPAAMQRAPRPAGEAIVTPRHWAAVGAYGLLITAAVLGALAIAVKGFGLGEKDAVTISFLTLATAQLWHVFNMNFPGAAFPGNDITRNPWVWLALGLCLSLLLAAVYVPVFASVLDVAAPSGNGWALILVMSFLPLAGGRVVKSLLKV